MGVQSEQWSKRHSTLIRRMEQSSWVRFEEEDEATLETSRRRSKNISTSSSSLSSSLSSIGSTSMEKRMADFTADLDVEQFSAHLILDFAVARWRGIAVFQPVMNGVGGNLVAVQASRLSTDLHCGPGSLP